ncbi:unnamed protein product [Vitrella brassicaformis CCMP3155]|uniref:Uncharacterized protein n=1 Tax=Vitrella brassicaformis (strain CCMP3155) TaxID=1169540 RepID=A0A0G4FHW6_VITBC|nr:unnamed protein product [Vitrella brassicaformis CCMP3155]|eukprot:CEM12678.1 unnamed protein product [Vitrella brassicaformis CCMP3155]
MSQAPPEHLMAAEELRHIFSYSPPWELGQQRLNKDIMAHAPAHYTHLSIDWDDQTTRSLWEKMPDSAARQWGERAVNLKELLVRFPRGFSRWRRTTWR